MDFSFLSVLLQVILSLLLFATIIFGLRLQRIMRSLRDDREELKNLFKDFERATVRAERAMEILKKTMAENSSLADHPPNQAEQIYADITRLYPQDHDTKDGERENTGKSAQDTVLFETLVRGGSADDDSGAMSSREKAEGLRLKSRAELMSALKGIK